MIFSSSWLAELSVFEVDESASGGKAKSEMLFFWFDTKRSANALGRQHARGGLDHFIEVVLGQIESFVLDSLNPKPAFQ
jgi:hypothetical protein